MKRWFLSLAVLAVVLALLAGATLYLAPLQVSDAGIRLKLWREGVHSRYVEVDGYRIHYFEAPAAGSQPGIPLLLVHGLGARGEDWAAMIPALAAKGFHVYAPDLLGYGRSPRPDVNYAISLEEKTVADFMAAVGLKRADVGGWSMGGWVALKLTIDHPELVNRLVIYDSAGIYFPATFPPSLFTPRDGAGLVRLQAMLSPDPPKLPAFVQNAAIRKLHRNGWVIDRSVSAMLNGRDLLDFKLQNIHRPTLIVWGSADKLIPLSVGETMHRDISGSLLLVIDGCGHLAPLECSKPVVSGTVGFLRADPPLAGGEISLPGRYDQPSTKSNTP